MLMLDELEDRLEFEDDWLNDELDEAIDNLLFFFETSSLDLDTGFDIITPTEYVAWVQRSLNRHYCHCLVTDGHETASYRQLVRKFQADYGLPATGEVDSSTQNQIIKANESNRTYMAWVSKTIIHCSSTVPFPADFDPVRKKPDSQGSYKSNSLKSNIKLFQKEQGLVEDGWVGPETETKVIECCKRYHFKFPDGGDLPGDCLPPGNKKKFVCPARRFLDSLDKKLIRKAIKLLDSRSFSGKNFSNKERKKLQANLIKML